MSKWELEECKTSCKECNNCRFKDYKTLLEMETIYKTRLNTIRKNIQKFEVIL